MIDQLLTVAFWWCEIGLWIAWGLRQRKRGQETRFRKRSVIFASVGWLGITAYYATQPGREAWPLHVCDLAGALALLVLWRGQRWARALLYFWALGLTAQAFVTPINQYPVSHVRWWFFWGSHSWVVGAALYDVIVLRFRPDRKDLLRSVGLSTAYVGSMVVLNEATGFNYGFVGSQGTPPGIVSLLGPWPGRVAWMVVVGTVLFVLLWLPWAIAKRVSFKTNSGAAPE